VGKTSITLGFVAALRRRGLNVQTYKVGPDYLDPTHLALASGRPCLNLDPWMCGRDYVRELFSRTATEFSVVEGVMGLFDGADPTGLDGSTAEVASLLRLPIALVANAHGAGRSFAATVHGFHSFEPGIRIGGVVANRCGSARHAELLSKSLAAAGLPPLLGGVPRGALPELPSRHLGLVSAAAGQPAETTLTALADALETSGLVESLLACAGSAEDPSDLSDLSDLPPLCRLAVARDKAFHFYYPDNLAALEHAGCKLVFFSPLRDTLLPEGISGIYLGGGYPEEHASALAANAPMLAAIRAFAANGGLIYAECGGLMYLSEAIETRDGSTHPMLGLLPSRTRMLPRRKSLGYVEATFERDCLWGCAGETLRGHEFHYSELCSSPDWPTVYSLRYRRSDRPAAEGFQNGRILASYAHLHFASRPAAVAHFTQLLKCP